MTNIDHAADIIEDLTDEPHLYPDGGLPDAAAHALADAGLLAPEPQVIRTRDELATLDPDTVVTDGLLTTTAGLAALYAQIGMLSVPVVVITTGDHARAARQALEATDAVD